MRGRADDGVVLTTYGRSSGFCVDPIEKKPLNHFLPGTSVLSFGTAGCNLACRFCQNWDISKSKEIDRLSRRRGPRGHRRPPPGSSGCASVAFTYNDPVVFLEYAVDTAAACREAGVKTVAVSAGYANDAARRELYSAVDAANIDLKGFTEDFYRHVAMGALAPVLDTLEYILHETDTWLEITTLLIPGLNDSDAELQELTTWVDGALGPDVPLHFSAFHPDYRMRDVPPTPPATLTRARQIAMDNGLRHVYTGNVHDARGRHDSVPRLRCGRHRAGLVRAAVVEPHRRRSLPGLRHPAGRRVRRPARRVGSAAGYRSGSGTGRPDDERRPPLGCGPPPWPGCSTPLTPTRWPPPSWRTWRRLPDTSSGPTVPAGRRPMPSSSPTPATSTPVPSRPRPTPGSPPAATRSIGSSCSAPPTRSPPEPWPYRPSTVSPLRSGSCPSIVDALASIATMEGVEVDDRPHADEHSLEVHIPFLQVLLGPTWTLVPVVVGRCAPDLVAAVLDRLWGGPETLVVISTDLSHYHDHARLGASMRPRRPESSSAGPTSRPDRACGAFPLRRAAHPGRATGPPRGAARPAHLGGHGRGPPAGRGLRRLCGGLTWPAP